MKAELYSKLSNYVLWGFAAIILVVFVLFFCAGETQVLPPASDSSGSEGIPYPEYTSLSLYLCYGMGLISVSLVLIFETIAVIKNLQYSTKGLLKRIVRIILVIAAIIGLYLISPDQWDFLIYLQYVLFAIAVLCMLGSFVISKIRS